MTTKLRHKNIKPSWASVFRKIIDPKKNNKEHKDEIPKIITRYLLYKAKTEVEFLGKEAKKYKSSYQRYIEAYISKMNEIRHKDDKAIIMKKQKEKKENESKQLNNKDIIKQIQTIKEKAHMNMTEEAPKLIHKKYRNIKSRYLAIKPTVSGKTQKISESVSYIKTEPRTFQSTKEVKPKNSSILVKRASTHKDLVRQYVLKTEPSYKSIENSKCIVDMSDEEDDDSYITQTCVTSRNENSTLAHNTFASYLNKKDLYYS